MGLSVDVDATLGSGDVLLLLGSAKNIKKKIELTAFIYICFEFFLCRGTWSLFGPGR